MSYAVHIAFAAWSILTVASFLALPARKAVLASLVVGVLLLPIAGYPVTGLRSKLMIMSVVVGMSAITLAPGRLLRIRPSLFDVPILVWCAWPMTASVANGLGAYEGFSAVLENFLSYGVPYLLGRAYFADLLALRDLAVAVFLGGVAYVPLCLWEIRFSPQLHRLVYGFHQHSFVQTIRFGGYRPVVFMDHGLMVAMWMTAASLAGLSLWLTGSLRAVFGVPIRWVVAALVLTAVLCKSAGALALLACGTLVVVLARRFKTALPLVVLLLASPTYLALRIAGRVAEEQVVGLARDASGAERSQSLQFRFWNEQLLLARALEKPVTGWGRWGRFLVVDAETGRSATIPDGLWIVALGEYGLVGLGAIAATLLLPVYLFLRRYRVERWSTPQLGPAAALALILALYMIDNIANAMINPLYFLAAGALTGVKYTPDPRRHARTAPVSTARFAQQHPAAVRASVDGS